MPFSCGICSLTVDGRNKNVGKNGMFPCSETVFLKLLRERNS